MIAFITGNKCFGNIVRDFRLMKEIKRRESVTFLHFVPEILRPLYEEFRRIQHVETEHYFYQLERQSLSLIHRVLAHRRPDIVVSDLAFFGPIICRMLGLANILITQPYPIKGAYADNYNNCIESLACADQIILPVPSFFHVDPELMNHTDKTVFSGPLILKEESSSPGKDLLITYSSGFYGLRLHFDVLKSLDSIMKEQSDLTLLLHVGGLSSQNDIEQLTREIEKWPEYKHRIRVLGFVESLVDIVKTSRVVVCHGGNIMFEASMMGIPRLLVIPPLDKNTEHYKNARHLHRIGAAELAVLGDPIKDHVGTLLTDERVRNYHITVGKNLCTWDGLEKVARLIMEK
ncbi:MAG: glycosyltransferase [Candidatus Methanofastidiosia archaeon]